MHRVAYRVLGKPIFLGFRNLKKKSNKNLNVLTLTQKHIHTQNCDDEDKRFFLEYLL